MRNSKEIELLKEREQIQDNHIFEMQKQLTEQDILIKKLQKEIMLLRKENNVEVKNYNPKTGRFE